VEEAEPVEEDEHVVPLPGPHQGGTGGGGGAARPAARRIYWGATSTAHARV
jgi:hypothetical protein